MSILIDNETQVMIIGITGKQGRIHCRHTLETPTKLVCGVAPGKGGQEVEGVPVFDTVTEARQSFPDVKTAMLLVPPRSVRKAALDALEAGIELLVMITEFVPVHDSLAIVGRARELGARVVGPNTIGVISPGKCKVGIMPDYIYGKGHIGIISRSGTLTHETASNLTFKGFGLSTCIGIGGDPVIGTNHAEAIELFADDDETDVIVLIGEIGGVSEELCAAKIRNMGLAKPVFAYIAGMSAPEGKKMGHAGAIVSGGMGTVASKVSALKAAGVTVCPTLGVIVDKIDELNRMTQGRLKTLEERTE